MEIWMHASWRSVTRTQDGEDHSGRHKLRACLRAADLALILCVVAEVTRFNKQVEFTCRRDQGSQVRTLGSPCWWFRVSGPDHLPLLGSPLR